MEINIRKVLKEKNPSLAKWIPGFVVSYLERIVHQDDLNDFMKVCGHKQGADFLQGIMDYFNLQIELDGIENIKDKKRAMYVSNHPLGGFDGIILMKVLHHQFGDVKVLVNDILMNIKNLEPFFLPVNKHGSQNKSVITSIENAYFSDVPVLSFPAGLCSRKIKGIITDLEWKKNFVHKAVESKRDVVPIYFEGKNSSFFYNLSNIRKKLGIKANIEMLYLADEMFKHRNGSFKITLGKAIPFSTFDKSMTQQQWAQNVKEKVYALKSRL